MKTLFLILSLLFGSFAYGESTPPAPLNPAAEATSTGPVIPPPPPLDDEAKEVDELAESLYGDRILEPLSIAARFETAFLTGNAIVQGFTLSSAQLTFFGDVSPQVAYTFALGQTREYSTALLPQIIPIDAHIDVRSQKRHQEVNHILLRVGMFTPEFHPLFTPDLAELSFPTNHQSHSLLFLNNELGIATDWVSAGDKFGGGVSFLNGTGIVSQNTNNAKSATAYWQYRFNLGAAKARVGMSGFVRFQSVQGNLNYRKDWLAVAWGELEFSGVKLLGDYFFGSYQDSSSIADPFGYSVFLTAHLDAGLHFWARYEAMENPPNGGTNTFYHWEAGPMVHFSDHIRLFGSYGQFDDGTGAGIEKEFRLHMRFTI